jgi:hypothetical protein
MNKSVNNEVYQSDKRIAEYKRLFKSDAFKSNVNSIQSLDTITQAKACDIVANIFCQFNALSMSELKKAILTRDKKIEAKLFALCIDSKLTMRNIDNASACYKRLTTHLKRDKLSRLVKRHA